jgi:hypothetical protein
MPTPRPMVTSISTSFCSSAPREHHPRMMSSSRETPPASSERSRKLSWRAASTPNATGSKAPTLRFWYDRPSTTWNEAYRIGNGRPATNIGRTLQEKSAKRDLQRMLGQPVHSEEGNPQKSEAPFRCHCVLVRGKGASPVRCRKEPELCRSTSRVSLAFSPFPREASHFSASHTSRIAPR